MKKQTVRTAGRAALQTAGRDAMQRAGYASTQRAGDYVGTRAIWEEVGNLDMEAARAFVDTVFAVQAAVTAPGQEN